MSIASIIAKVEVAIEPVIVEAEAIAVKVAEGAFHFLEGVAISAAMKAVALVKETSLGTAIMNLVSAASTSSDASGGDKFAAVLSAAEAAYNAFVGAGGLSGLIAAGLSILRQLVQSIYDDFAAASAKALVAATTSALTA